MAQLREFYRAVNRNVKGLSNDPWFNENVGLCANMMNYALCKCSVDYYNQYRAMFDRMLNQFSDAGLSRILPFNKKISYSEEGAEGRIYQNEARLKWIKDHV